MPNYITDRHTGFCVQSEPAKFTIPCSHFQTSSAQGPLILRSQVNRGPGLLEFILFLCCLANLCLKRSAGGSELLCDPTFPVNEACSEWKHFLTAHKLSQASINPTDSSMVLHLLVRCKVLLYQSLGEQKTAAA